MAHSDRINDLLDDLLVGTLSRRSLVKRATALGLTAPAIATLSHVRAAAAAGSLTVASNQSDAIPRARVEAMVNDFKTANPGVDVTLNTTEHEAFKQQIRQFLASDSPPDVLTWFAGNRMRFFVDKKLVMPVSDLYKAQGWETKYAAGIRAVSKGKDGEYYFVPQSYYWWAIYYRPSLLQKAGVEAPPKTFDELLAACDKITAAGMVPFTIGLNAPWPAAAWFDYLNMRTNGAEFHVKLTDGQVAYNSPEVKETFANWKKLLDKKVYIKQPEALKWEDAITPMFKGQAAMYLMGKFITDSYPKDGVADLDFFQFPKINDHPMGEDAPTDGLFAAAKAKHPDQAKAFLAFAGSAAVQKKLAQQDNGPLAVNGDVPLDIYPAPTQKGIKMLQSAGYIAQFYDRDTTPEMADKGMAAFVQFMANPGDANSILDALDEERKRIFSAQQT